MCKGSSQSTTNQKPDPRAMRAYLNVFRKAQKAAAEPYQAYERELVADPTADMNAAYASIRGLQGAYQPAFDKATAMFDRAGQPITPMAFSKAAVDQYMDPYLSNVVDTTAANIARENAIAQRRLQGNAISRGAFGGDRSGVAAAELERSQGLARNQTMAELMSKGYGQALGMFNTQQGVDLNAQQQNVANALAAGQNWYNFGQGQVQTGLGVANAQLQAGQLQQQQRQNELNSLYQQWQNRKAYPFQSIGWLGNIVSGVGNNTGGTSTTTQAPPSLFSGLVGLGTAGLGAISDRRMKTGVARVGRTDDGQPIYRFRYKGDPSGVAHMGLMAQEVEKKHPGAVQEDAYGVKHVDYDRATGKAAGGGVAPAGAMSPYASDYIGLDPFGTRKDDFIVRVPGLALGGAVEDEPYSSGLGYVPKPKSIGGGGKWGINAPPPEKKEGLMGLGVSTKELTDLGVAAKSAAPKIKGILGLEPPKPPIAPEGQGGIGSMARGGRTRDARGVSKAAFSTRSDGSNPGNEWGAGGTDNGQGQTYTEHPGYNNPLADNPNGGIMDGWGVGMADSGMNSTGYVPGMDQPSLVSLGSNTQGLPGPPVGRTYGWNSQIASRYTGTGGPAGPAVGGRRGLLGGTALGGVPGAAPAPGGVMGGGGFSYSGPMSDAGYGSVADPNNYGGFAGHGYGTHDYGIGAQAAGFAGGDNYGLSDFSGNSPSSNGPSSGGSSGGYSGAGTGGFGGADGFESRARGGRAQQAAPMAMMPPGAQAPAPGFTVVNQRRTAPARALGATTRSAAVEGPGGQGGWDPAGNPVDPGFNSGGTFDGRTPTGPNIYEGDGVFGGTLRDDGGWLDIGGWQNAGDYLRGQLPEDPNGFQGVNFDMAPDFSSQPMASRGWSAFGPNGLQPGAMGPAPNPHPLGYSYSPSSTAGGSSGSYGGFSGSADAPGTSAGTGSFGSADGYDSRARGGGVSAMAFARGGARRPPAPALRSSAKSDPSGDAFNDAGGYGGLGSEAPPGRPGYEMLSGDSFVDMGNKWTGYGDGTTNIYGQPLGIQTGFNQPPVPGQVPIRTSDVTITTKGPPAPPGVTVRPAGGGKPVTVPGAVVPGGAGPAPGGSAPAGYSGNYSDAGYGSVADPNNYGGYAGHGYGTHDYGVGAQMTGFTGADNFGFTDFNGSEPGSNGPSSGGSSGGYSGAGSGGFGGADGFESRARGGGVGPASMRFATGGVPMSAMMSEEEARAILAKERAGEEADAARFIAQGKATGDVDPVTGLMPKTLRRDPAQERPIPGSRRAIPMTEEPDMPAPKAGVAAIARAAGEPAGVAAVAKPEPKGGIEGLAARIKNTFTGEGEGFSPETRAALMAAGFGIMAGGSRNPFMNIGAGGLKGVEQYNVGITQGQNTRRLDQAATQLAQDLLRIQNETKLADAEVDVSRRVGIDPKLIFGAGNVPKTVVMGANALPDGTAVTRPVTPAPGGGAAVTPGGAAVDAGKKTIEEVLNSTADAGPRPINEVVKADALADPGNGVAWVEPLQRRYEARSAPVIERTQTGARAAQANVQRLKTLEHVIDAAPKSGLFAPGATADARTAFGGALLDAATVAGISPSKTAGLSRDVGNAQEWNKTVRTMAAEIAAAGGQESYGALQSSLETVPSQMLATVGSRRILEGLKAINQRQLDKASFMESWQRQNPGVPLDTAEKAFDVRYPPDLYATRAIALSIPRAKVNAFLRDDHPQAAADFDAAFGKGSAAAVKRFKWGE